VKAACAALGVARATFYRRRRPRTTGRRQPRPKPARALSEAERSEVFDVLCSPRFADRAPAEVYATLLDEGVHLCSERGSGARPALSVSRFARNHTTPVTPPQIAPRQSRESPVSPCGTRSRPT